LPQMVFSGARMTLLTSPVLPDWTKEVLWKAIQNTQLAYEDWVVRKEQDKGHPILRLYIELKDDGFSAEQVSQLVDEQLLELDKDYCDLREVTEEKPLVVSLLKKGSFENYQKAKQAAGADLAHLKPVHISPSEDVIKELTVTE